MVKSGNRLGLFQVLRQTPFLPAHRSSQLLRKCLVLSELDKQWLMQKVLDIFVVVKRRGGGRALVRSFLVEGFTRVDSCESVYHP